MKTNPTTNMTKATRMMTRNSLRIGSIAIVALAAAAIAGCKGTADTAQPTATPVRTATAVTGPAAPPIRTNGLLLNKDEIRLSFEDTAQNRAVTAVAVDCPLGNSPEHFTYAAACGSTVWAGSEQGEVFRVEFVQESA